METTIDVVSSVQCLDTSMDGLVGRMDGWSVGWFLGQLFTTGQEKLETSSVYGLRSWWVGWLVGFLGHSPVNVARLVFLVGMVLGWLVGWVVDRQHIEGNAHKLLATELQKLQTDTGRNTNPGKRI